MSTPTLREAAREAAICLDIAIKYDNGTTVFRVKLRERWKSAHDNLLAALATLDGGLEGEHIHDEDTRLDAGGNCAVCDVFVSISRRVHHVPFGGYR